MEEAEFSNPWQVTSKDDFLFYCCPECDMKSKDYEHLYEHAIKSHDLAKETLVRHSVPITLLEEEVYKDDNTEVNEFVDTFNDEEEEEEEETVEVKDEFVETFIDEEEEQIGEVKVRKTVQPKAPSSVKSNIQWQCYYCGECYEDQLKCQTHVQNKHNATDQQMRYGREIRSFQCSVCLLMFKDENLLKIHVCGVSPWLEDGCKFFKCPKCDKEYPHYCKLTRHYAVTHTQEKKFKCDQCDYRTFTHNQLNEHSKSHKVSLTCDICRKRFKTAETLHKHKKFMHEKHEKPIKKCHMCHICGLEFKVAVSLTNHMAIQHQSVTADLICDKCGKGFPTKDLLRNHNYFSHRQKVFICTICQRAFLHVTKLAEHLRTEHQIVCGTSDIFSCGHCKSTFSTVKELNSHLVSKHFLENIKKCDECDTSVTTQALLQCHKIEAHAFNPFEPTKDEDTKKLKCDICNTFWKTKSTLTHHIKNKHNKDSHNIECDQCSFKTFRKSLLTVHKQHKHEGKRKIYSYTCSECSKTFPEKRYLRKHLIEEHNVTDQRDLLPNSKPPKEDENTKKWGKSKRKIYYYSCSECSKTVTCKRYLRNHLLKEHNITDQ